MKPSLNQKQRILAAIIYLIGLVVIFSLIGGNISKVIFGQSIDSSIWFYSGALLIVLGTYIAEPFFSKPSNVIINAVVVIVALLGLDNKSALIGYNFIFYFSVILLLLSIITIVLVDSTKDNLQKLSKVLYWISTNFGHNKVIFSLLYLLSATSYFGLKDEIVPYILMIALWICLIFFDIVGYIITFFKKLNSLISDKISEELGTAIGCENPLFYRVEIDGLKKTGTVNLGDIVAVETEVNLGAIGVVVSKWQLLNKEWLSIYLLQKPTKEFLTISLKLKKQFADPKSIFVKKNSVYKLNVTQLSFQMQEFIGSTTLYTRRNDFIGYVEKDSDIEKINFTIVEGANGKSPTEGSIIETPIYDELTQYQIINANTKREHLENYDFKGYTNGIARKLGRYDPEEKELNVRKWLPNIYSPIYYSANDTLAEEKLIEIADSSIGRLPNSEFDLPIKDYNSLVTHNTAILGILGIGKSCLSYELISKIVQQDIKVLCIDITNEYNSTEKGLPKYIDTDLINEGVDELNTELNKIEFEVADSREDGGNIGSLHDLLIADIKGFIDSNKSVRIINPDEIIAIQQTENAKNRNKGGKWEMYAPFAELTVAEVTRVISESALEVCKEKGISETARLLIVYEEAHSLIPEWNSVANDGDKYATNGTSKVILQGRKYGLGCFVITQRTANVTKSILNQCNTMFAMRVFDDTGKNFLENYFGRDYSSILPTLEERWAITVGRGLKLKQPVIIELNDKDLIIQDD
ncbi:ATP-binding protein [Flagellimonas sp. GZD32]|uniref:ATP-binding protein n=1 Tax=Flagellimonas cixiensis TaxID=3228750 RepID=UPI0035C8D9C4